MKNLKKINFIILIIIIAIFINNNPVLAGIGDWMNNLNKAAGGEGSKLYETNLKDNTTVTLAKYIGGILLIIPFLGMILIIRIIWAGYNWMTAHGNAEQVEDAQETIKHAVIGVVILASLYVIAYFIMDRLVSITEYQGF